MKKVLLLLMAIIVGTGFLSAQGSDPAYEVLFGSSYNSQKVQNYTSDWSVTIKGFTWNISKFNNNQNDWSYVRCGSGSASTAYISSAAKLPVAIGKIFINAQLNKTSYKVKKASVLVADNSGFNNADTYDITSDINALTKTATDIKVDIKVPAEGMFYKVNFEMDATSNGWLQINNIKLYAGDVVETPQATHVAINPAEGGTFENSKDVTLTALDAEGNAVEGAKVFYKIGDEAQQEGTSPVTFTLTKSATVEAWVGTETPATATFTITVPEVQPGNPVFSANGTTLTDEEATLPYGTELNITAENAVSLEVLAGEDVQEIQGNSYTITITDDTEIMVTAHNGSLSSEGMISVKLADPTLTVKAAGKVVANDETITLVKGSAIEVIATGAKEVLIMDPNGEEIKLDNNKFVPQLVGEYNIEAALTGHTSAEITFSVVLEDPQTTEVVATYDFTIGGAYGLTPFKTNNYEKKANNLKEKDVTIAFTGNYRQWESTGPVYDFRIYSGAKMTVKVPFDCYITNIKVDYSDKEDYYKIGYNGTVYNTNPANIVIPASEKLREITLNATAQTRIGSITVTYTKEKITASGVVALGDAVEYSYGHANVLTFKPTIYVGGQPIEENDYSNFKVSFMGKEIGVAEMNTPLSQFPYNKDGKFTLNYNGEDIKVSEVTGWPNIESDPVLHNNEGKIDVEYVKNDDNTVDVIYYVVPENAPQNMYWTVKSDEENASVYWREGHTGAACHFNNLGTWKEGEINVNHVEEFEARIAYPFAVLPVFGVAQRVAPQAENNIFISEYESTPTKKVSTANVPDPVEGGNVSGVTDVAVDRDAEVEFFNLQGVRVEGELTPGLYIRRQGNQASKVVVK